MSTDNNKRVKLSITDEIEETITELAGKFRQDKNNALSKIDTIKRLEMQHVLDSKILELEYNIKKQQSELIVLREKRRTFEYWDDF
jgi:hypothetical protein